jgi:hypothetical protein
MVKTKKAEFRSGSGKRWRLEKVFSTFLKKLQIKVLELSLIFYINTISQLSFTNAIIRSPSNHLCFSFYLTNNFDFNQNYWFYLVEKKSIKNMRIKKIRSKQLCLVVLRKAVLLYSRKEKQSSYSLILHNTV